MEEVAREPLAARPARLLRTGRALALLQVLQVATGLVGQAILVLRWAGDGQTDLFFLLGGVPWLMTSLLLFGELHVLFPASYQRLRAGESEASAARFVVQALAGAAALSLIAAGASAVLVTRWGTDLGIGAATSMMVGVLLGAQLLPLALSNVLHGLMLSHHRLVRLRLSFLGGSVVTALGYGLLSGPPLFTLPAVTFAAALFVAASAWYFARDLWPAVPVRLFPLHPEMRAIVRGLLVLGLTGGLAQLQLLAERAFLAQLGPGHVTLLGVAERGWGALLAVVIALGVTPAFPHWAERKSRALSRRLLRWSLAQTLRAAALSGLAVLALSLVVARAPFGSAVLLAHVSLALLPRSLLVLLLQPLIHRHYAEGAPFLPAVGSLLGLLVTLAAAGLLVGRYGLPGFTAATTLAVLPGLALLVWRERGRP